MGKPGATTPGPRRRILRGVAVGCVLAFLGLALARGWSEVAEYPWQLRPGWLLAGLATYPLYLLMTAFGYVWIVELLTDRAALRRRSLVALWGKSLLGRYVPGNAMMVAGRLELGRDLGVPRRVSLAATVYEQALVLGVSAIAGIGFLIAYGDLGQGAVVWATAVVPLCVVMLHPRIFRPVSTRLLRKARRAPLTVFLSIRHVVAMLAWYSGVVVLQGLATWMLIRSAAGPAVGGPPFVTLAFALAFTVSMLAFIFPSGLGVRDGLFALALAVRLPDSVALAVSVGYRLVATLAEMAFAAVAAHLERRALRARGETAAVGPEG
jgi:hypothetical protein